MTITKYPSFPLHGYPIAHRCLIRHLLLLYYGLTEYHVDNSVRVSLYSVFEVFDDGHRPVSSAHRALYVTDPVINWLFVHQYGNIPVLSNNSNSIKSFSSSKIEVEHIGKVSVITILHFLLCHVNIHVLQHAPRIKNISLGS